MRNLQEYGLWLLLVTTSTVIVSQWINQLILMSGEPAGLSVGIFLSLFLASLMFLLIRSVMFCFVKKDYEVRLQVTQAIKVGGGA